MVAVPLGNVTSTVFAVRQLGNTLSPSVGGVAQSQYGWRQETAAWA